MRTDTDTWVVRIVGENSRQIGIDRRRERDALRRATEAGIAPHVEVFLPDGHSVTRFVQDTQTYSPDEFTSPVMLMKVALRIRGIHHLAPIDGIFDPYDQIRTWLPLLDERSVRLPTRLAPLLERINQIEPTRRDYRGSVLCHNDVWAPNFLEAEKIWVIDWEYAGMGDPLFDLACVACRLDDELRTVLLDAYLVGDLNHTGHDVDRMVEVFLAFWTVWSLIQSTQAEPEFDYSGFAEELLDFASGGAQPTHTR